MVSASEYELGQKVSKLEETCRNQETKLSEQDELLEKLAAKIDALEALNDKITGGTKVLIFLGSLFMAGTYAAYNINGIKAWFKGG
jgi:predicted RNase H-like nuclease (RuvC/YqgF family)